MDTVPQDCVRETAVRMNVYRNFLCSRHQKLSLERSIGSPWDSALTVLAVRPGSRSKGL